MKEKIIRWLKKELVDSGAKGIVLGLSGGIDSSVVAALAKEAAGSKKVLALILPCHSLSEDAEDAKLAAAALGIKTKSIDLSGVYGGLLKILPAPKGIARANIKPRLRMLVLYYFANKFNYLVCGTGNKSEIKIGYFTKHGDGATDILPIGGLLKKDVRKLAQELGVPRRIIAKPASAGLWLGQTDEAEMGITYNELDDILERLEKGRKQVLKDKAVKVENMIKRSEHKRQGPKICRI